jgi:ribosomal protein S12 methylthiotransferase accessory factor
MGVTRVADITGLDRIGIPVHNAVVPRSNDILSVYNGKGTTPVESKTSAVMEAAERYAAALPRRPVRVGAASDLSRHARVLDLDEINLERFPRYSEQTPISWLEGLDLLNEETVLVPAFLAGYYPLGVSETPPFRITTTNGLASGNSIEEAICHGLCELIERDDWTMADLISYRFSRALQLGTLDGKPADPLVAEWFHERYPNVDATTLPEDAQRLIDRYERAGLHLKIKNVTSSMGIPSFVGIVAEYVADTFSRSHFGLGTHPDAEVAVARCITEVAQARLVDIHAMREDIAMPDQEVDKSMLHVKRKSRINPDTWYFKESRRSLPLRAIPSYPSDDVMIDLRLMLDRLGSVGLSRVVVVDLSPPDVPASVVRVVVPGIESWTIDRSRIGRRGTAFWNAAISALNATRNPATVAAPASKVLE